MTGPALLEVVDVVRHFPARGRSSKRHRKIVHAVDGVSLEIRAGETFSIVGESGCGKSTLGRLLLGVDTPTSGEVRWNGADIRTLRGTAWDEYRSAVQVVFQDPWSSLNPRRRVGAILADPLLANRRAKRADAMAQAGAALAEVGIGADALRRYPHEFSGGQRQRIAIARALIMRPRVIVLDEPASALDVSIQAQVLNLLKDLQREHGLAYVLISHNLATVRFMSDAVGVMYLGQLVEEGPAASLFDAPAHPYTRALIAASLPVEAAGDAPDLVLEGEVPSAVDPPGGCRFHTRCPSVMAVCHDVVPVTRRDPRGRRVVCHLDDEGATAVQVDRKGAPRTAELWDTATGGR